MRNEAAAQIAESLPDDGRDPREWLKAKGKAMVEGGATNKEVAGLLGLSVNTIRQLRSGEMDIPDDMLDEMLRQERGRLHLSRQIVLDALVDPKLVKEKIEGATLQQLATTFGILFDKGQLMDGKPTSIQRDIAALPDAEIQEELEKLRNELALEAEFSVVEEPPSAPEPNTDRGAAPPHGPDTSDHPSDSAYEDASPSTTDTDGSL